MFVSEILEHPVDLLKTHVQANITYFDDKLIGVFYYLLTYLTLDRFSSYVS